MWLIAIASSIGIVVVISIIAYLLQHSTQTKLLLLSERIDSLLQQRQHSMELMQQLRNEQTQQRQNFDVHQINSLKTIQQSLHEAAQELRQQVTATLTHHSEQLTKQVAQLTEQTHKQLKDMSQEVDRQLTAGFEKTSKTFIDITKRLTIIDQAQQKITELSSNVVSLQEILADKKSRGAFGEVQLSALIGNMIPDNHFSLQHTLSNSKRCDCILFLPEPTGNIVIDSKFPLESYQAILDNTDTTKLQTFKRDIKKHIQDIANRYIIPGETADGAMMFIPAEAIFAEIHAHHTDLVSFAQRQRIWLVSPTTMMAVLTTARAVLKDAATRKQVHIIQEHLTMLGKDFDRFQKRMDNLSKHIAQANEDVDLVYKSSKKITSRFAKIEQAELPEQTDKQLLDTD